MRTAETGSPFSIKIYDLVIEDISVVGNYRSQFDRITARSSFVELVRTMKEKQS